MPSLIGRRPARTALQQALQLAEVVHAQAVEISPAGDAEQVLDDHGGVALAGQALVAGQFLGSLFGFVTVVVGVEQFHAVVVDTAGADWGLCPS